ncbi:hypothetical protein GYB61_10935 [bacterium]|nr:hypothetical protein [bacterium]
MFTNPADPQAVARWFLLLCAAALFAPALWSGASAQGIVDGDADGVPFAIDECPYSRPGEFVDARGCTTLRDSDEDGIADEFDDCPLTDIGAVIGPDGCAIDTDKDGVADGLDQCAGTPSTQPPDQAGCSAVQLARRRSAAAEPNVVVGLPRPSSGQSEVVIERPRPAADAQRPVIEPAPLPVEALAPPVVETRPAAVFSASGRSVDFVPFASLGFAAATATLNLGSPTGQTVTTAAASQSVSELAESARFASPPVAANSKPSSPDIGVSTPALKPVPTTPPAAVITAPAAVAAAPAQPVSEPQAAVRQPAVKPAKQPPVVVPQQAREADPKAFSPMAQAVATALLGLAPQAAQ